MYGVTWVYELKVNRRDELQHGISDATRRIMTLLLYVKFKSSWITNIHSPITIDNQAYVHTIFLTWNDLRTKILKYWYKVTGHTVSVTIAPSLFSHCCHIWLLFWRAEDTGKKQHDTEQHTMSSYKALKCDTWTVLCMAMTQNHISNLLLCSPNLEILPFVPAKWAKTRENHKTTS